MLGHNPIFRDVLGGLINTYYCQISQEKRVKIRRLGVILGFVCFLSSEVLASNDFSGVGNWADPNIWSGGHSPSGAEKVKVRGEDTICTLNTSTGGPR